jgi:DHA1 family bicyclomycin/chloramphenicol resistance-like MFS transporter
MLTYVFAGYLSIAAMFLALSLATGGRPAFPAFFIVTTLLIMGHIVIGALTNSLAMQDVGHIAGTASAVIGTVTMLGGSFLGALTDHMISDSVLPFALGLVVYGATASVFALRSLPARTAGQVTMKRRPARGAAN